MEGNIVVIGKIIKCKDKVLLLGQMVECILECIMMIKSMDLEHLNGPMEENT